MGIVSRALLAGSFLLAPAGMASAATMVVPAQSFGPLATDFSNPTTDGTGPFTLAGFDSSLGTLTGVHIDYSFTDQMAGTVRNNAPNAQTFKITESSDLTFSFTGPAAGDYVASVSKAQNYANLGSGVTANFGPANTGYTLTDAGSFNPVNIADFVNTPFSFTVSSLTGTAILGGGGNIAAAVSTQASGFASVTYTYDAAPAALPEPAAWAMMLVGFGGVGTMLRRSSRQGATLRI